MKDFDLHIPTKILFGKGKFKLLGESIRQHGCEKIILIAGGGSIKDKNSAYEDVTRGLENGGIRWSECWGVRPNPTLAKVLECIDLARAEEVDGVLGVGGGSVIDTAKAVAAGVMVDDVWDLFSAKKPVYSALPVFAGLTLSGTGTEMDPFAVITKEDSLHKWNISGPALYPRLSAIDPALQMSLPWKETACGAVDALSHIMEFYFAGVFSETTLSVNEALTRSIVRVTDALKNSPRDYDLRADLAWASTLALNGISGAGQDGGDWATHYIEHAVSAYRPEVAHAEGLGVIFPAWISYVHEKTGDEVFSRWAREVWGVSEVKRGVSALRSKLREWEMPLTLSELGIERDDLGKIASKASEYGQLGYIHTLGEKEIMDILVEAWR